MLSNYSAVVGPSTSRPLHSTSNAIICHVWCFIRRHWSRAVLSPRYRTCQAIDTVSARTRWNPLHSNRRPTRQSTMCMYTTAFICMQVPRVVAGPRPSLVQCRPQLWLPSRLSVRSLSCLHQRRLTAALGRSLSRHRPIEVHRAYYKANSFQRRAPLLPGHVRRSARVSMVGIWLGRTVRHISTYRHSHLTGTPRVAPIKCCPSVCACAIFRCISCQINLLVYRSIRAVKDNHLTMKE